MRVNASGIAVRHVNHAELVLQGVPSWKPINVITGQSLIVCLSAQSWVTRGSSHGPKWKLPPTVHPSIPLGDVTSHLPLDNEWRQSQVSPLTFASLLSHDSLVVPAMVPCATATNTSYPNCPCPPPFTHPSLVGTSPATSQCPRPHTTDLMSPRYPASQVASDVLST